MIHWGGSDEKGEGFGWICSQVKELFGEVATVETKVGMGTAALGLHPEVVRRMIRSEVTSALQSLDSFRPYKLKPPYRMVLKVKEERGFYSGAEKTGPGEFTYTSPDLLKVMDAFNAMK